MARAHLLRCCRVIAALPLALLAACGTVLDAPHQVVVVQAVQNHQEVFGVGCVLSNDVGRWFVTAPGRVTVRKSHAPLRVDCRKDGVGSAYERVASKENGTLWGNIVFTAGIGYAVDRHTGQGFDYPSVLTVLMHAGPPGDDRAPPPEGVIVY